MGTVYLAANNIVLTGGIFAHLQFAYQADNDEAWELVCTPGHHFLKPDGSFAAIADIIADDGRIVHVDGSVITVEAERIVYSSGTAHLYEQHAMLKTWTSGGLAMAPEHVEGWRTYNFEALETQKYTATQDARHAA